MARRAWDVELDRLVHEKPLAGRDPSPPACGALEQLPNVPSYRAATRTPVLVSTPKAGVVNPNFCTEEQSPLGIRDVGFDDGDDSWSSCFFLLLSGGGERIEKNKSTLHVAAQRLGNEIHVFVCFCLITMCLFS